MNHNTHRSFFLGCLLELLLLLVALILTWVFRGSLWTNLRWEWQAATCGVLAAIPPLFFFVWALHSDFKIFSRHRQLFEGLVRPLFGNWSVPQLALISLLAGSCEEALFRGAIQTLLATALGRAAALALASALFGCAHLLTWTYGLLATLIGAYLGFLFIGTGNLLAPMITHVLYDFLALLYFLKFSKPPPK